MSTKTENLNIQRYNVARGKKVKQERSIKKEIAFKLTTKDRAEFGDQFAKLNGAFGEIDREFDKIKKDYKGRLEAIDLQVNQIAKWLRDGEQHKIVDVIERKDFVSRKVQFILENKVVEEREMNPDETQVEMPIIGGEVKINSDVADVIKKETKKKTKTSPLEASL